jgi:HD-GYP domain-containing protein (c-di-GMP phosphodiesterase class II)
MPGRNGLELLRDIRARYPDTAVMMLTGDLDVTSAVECLRNGAIDYLAKPIRQMELSARVHKALADRQVSVEVRQLRASYQEDLERQVNELSQKNKAMFLAQVQMAVKMLEAKDPYTRGHSGRVSQLSVAIGQHMRLPGVLLEQLRLGGELHDIGKIGTRDAVLNKRGPLTTEEFAEMRRHTIDGEAMLDVLRDDHPAVLHIVRWHHEHLDGGGFPDGLVGDRIPLAARIVSVADAFDAMTTTRPYRDGQSDDRAWSELQRCAGTQFDPDVLSAFREVSGKRSMPS